MISHSADVSDLKAHLIVCRPSSLLILGPQALLLLVIGTMPILFGAVQAWVWPIYVVAIDASFLMLIWSESCSGPRANLWWLAPAVFLILTLIPCLPLPPMWVAWLSPQRWSLLHTAQALSGRSPAVWTVSYAPLPSLAWWAFMLSLAFLFCVARACIAHPVFLKTALWVLFGLAVLEALYGLLQALIPNLGVLWVTYLKSGMGDARGTYINRNHFAGFMEMLLPLLSGFSLSRVRWGKHIGLKPLLHSEHLHQHMLMILGLVVMALALLFSKSRGGITGALLGLLMFLLFSLRSAAPMRRAIWALCGLFFGLTLLYGLRIGFDPIIDRFLALEQGQSRLEYWRDSLPIIASHPFGIGLAALKQVFPIYDASMSSDRVMAIYLHNDVLQLLVEAGWLAFCAIVIPFMIFMVKIFRRIRSMEAARDPDRFFLACGAYGGLAALSMHSFFDFNLQIPANAALFVLLMAIARVTTEEKLKAYD